MQKWGISVAEVGNFICNFVLFNYAANTSSTITTDGDGNWYSQSAVCLIDGDAAQSGQISHNQQTWMQTTFEGLCIISFAWKVSSEEDYDYLKFYVDGNLREEISGEIDGWQYVLCLAPGTGSHTMEWVYTKDYSVSSGEDCGWIDDVYLRGDSVELSEALDYSTSTIVTDEDSPWFGESRLFYNDEDAAQSHQIGDNQQTWMQTTVNGCGNIKFFWKVSSEAGYDYLKFYIDGEVQDSISGKENWEQRDYIIYSSGTRSLKWEYSKDDSVNFESDCGWVDKVEWLPLVESPTNVVATNGVFMETVRITWDAVSGANGYTVFNNTTNNVYTAEKIGTPSDSHYYDFVHSSGTKYWYWVQAYNTFGNSDYSYSDSGWLSPTVATNVAASDGSFNDKIQITWTPSLYATGYKIYRNIEDDLDSAGFIGISYSAFYEDTASNDQTFFYWIRVFDDVGDGCYSQSDFGWRKGDDAALEVGTYWVSNYDHWDDVPSEPDAQSFLSVMEDHSNYNTAFEKGDALVDELLFTDTNNPENSPDGVDIFWFQGHGQDGDLVLIHDWFFLGMIPIPDRVSGQDLSWGDSDNEWVFLLSCDTLISDDAPSNGYLKSNGKFAKALCGTHMICGAITPMVPAKPGMQNGANVAGYLTGTGGPEHNAWATVRDSWMLGIDEGEDIYLADKYPIERPVIVRVIAEDEAYLSDYIDGIATGPISDVPVDDYYVSWDYSCTRS